MANDDGEFRGTTKQAIHDLTDRLGRFETNIMDQILEIGARFDGKLDAVVKRMEVQEDRYSIKFASSSLVSAMDDEIKGLGTRLNESTKDLRKDVEALKQWRLYIVGIMSAIGFILVFFGDAIRRVIFG